MEEVEVQSVGGGAAVTAVTVVTALTAVAAVIDSGGREAGVPAVKLLAAAHWSITSIVNRPFNSRLLLTARRAVYGPKQP